MLAKPLAACTHVSSTVSQLFEPQVQKIAVFTYRSPHFCFPWRRPSGNHAIYVAWMERQFNACLTPRSMYLSIFNSFRVIGLRCLNQCVSPKIGIFITFWFPLGTPLGQSRYVLYGWKENSMLTNCLAACAHLRLLSITISEIQWDIPEKIGNFSYPLVFDAPFRGVPVGISAPPLVRENWNGVATRWWKNFEDIFIRFGATHERDGRTDGQTSGDSIYRAYAYASRGKNQNSSYELFWLKVNGSWSNWSLCRLTPRQST